MAFNKLEATREWVNKWRQDNGVGPNVTPAKEVVPFKWMHPLLKKVESNGLQIAEVQPWQIEQEAPDGTRFNTPVIEGDSPDKGIGPERFPKPGFTELTIAGDPSFTVGGGKGSSTNQKIIRSGDANAPNATNFMKIRNLGPAMFPIKKAELNPLQIKALKAIPSDLKKRSPTERLQIMRDVTEKVKGLA